MLVCYIVSVNNENNFFYRGNIVEPLSRILEPVSVRHLDIDSPVSSPKQKGEKPQDKSKDVVQRRQMPSQLVRLGSIDKDPGVIGPLVWDLHCQRIKDGKILVLIRLRHGNITVVTLHPVLNVYCVNGCADLCGKITEVVL